MGLFADLQERVGSLWDGDDDGGESGSRDRSRDRNRTREHDRERPREHSAETTRDAAPAAPGAGRTQEEHEEEDEGGGGLLGMVSSAIRNPRQAAAGAARAMTTAAASSVLGPVVAPALGEMAAAGVEAVADLASEGGSRLAHGAAEMGGAALRGVGAEETAAMVERAPARIAQAAGDLQEGAAQYVDRDVRQALVGNGEDGEGLIGSFAEGVEAGSHVAATGLGQVRAIASDPGVARVLETVSMGALTGEEINEEVDDIARGLSDFVDEDIRDMVAGEQRHAPENPELRLEDPAAQRDVERRARILFNATDGAGTDPEQITEAMRGASPDAIAAMEALMWREHGIDMRRTLDRELSGSSEDEILGTEDGPGGMISGDPVEQALSEIGGATHGMITESDRIEAAIRSVPADRRAEVIERMGGEDAAEATLRRETRGQDPAGTDGQVATALLENRDADAIALRLDESLNRGTGEMLGHAIGIDDQDISDLDRQVHRWVGDRVGDLMGADEAARERARREMGDHTPYFAALNDLFGNQDEVAAQLENIPADQRQAVERSFARITRGSSETLEANLEHEMEAGPERDRAVALLHGDRAAADAAALQLAADQPLLTSSGFVEQLFLGPIAMTENVMNGGRPDINATDTEGFMQVLQRREGESDDQYQERRGEMEHILRERYGSDLDELMSDELGEGSLDHQRARDLSDDGELDWRFQLRYAAEREIGTDEDMYLAGLRRAAADPTLTDEERAELREEAFENPLSELDGRPALEAQEILEGPPADDAEQVDRWLRRHEFDRDTLGRALVDVHSQSGTDYDRHMRELQAIRGRMEDGHVRDEDRARFEEIGRILEGDQASYRTRQDETADAAAQAAAVTAAAVVTVATAGSATPATAAMLAALAAGGAGMAARGTVLGDAYEREDIAADGVRAVASAGAAGLGSVAGAGANTFGQRALAELPGAALTHGTDLALSEEDLTWGTIGRHAMQTGGDMLGAGVGGIAEDAVSARMRPGLANSIASNVASGAAETVTSQSLDPSTWDDGVGQGLANIAGQTAISGVRSTASGIAGHHRAQVAERAAAAQALAGTAPRPLGPGEPDAGDEFRADLDAHERARSEAARAAAAAAAEPAPEPVLGSRGIPFDPDYVPGPYEPVNYPPNNGAAHTPVQETLPPGHQGHRRGHEGGSYWSPDGTPIPDRSLPPEYVIGPEPLDYTPEEHFYEIGPDGLVVNSSATAPAFGQPGGGTQYQAQPAEGETRAPSIAQLVRDGSLIETQANFAEPASPAEQEEIRIALEEEAAMEASRRSRGSGGDPPGGGGGDGGGPSGGPEGPESRAIDARTLLALQAEHEAEVAVSAPRLPDGSVADHSTISIGSEDGVSVPDGHVGSVHTHPGATDDPRVRFPSDGQGDLGSVRQHGNTQAVVHDEGVTVFHPGSVSQDIDGLVGDQGSVQPVARRVDNVTMVESTQVVLDHDETGSVVISPSPDNPEQGMLPVSFPQGTFFAPGTSADNVEALRAHNEAQQREAARVAEEAEAARVANEGRPIVGWTSSNQPLYEGETPTERWQDAQGRWHFPDED